MVIQELKRAFELIQEGNLDDIFSSVDLGKTKTSRKQQGAGVERRSRRNNRWDLRPTSTMSIATTLETFGCIYYVLYI